jgi:hypothetical protein
VENSSREWQMAVLDIRVDSGSPESNTRLTRIRPAVEMNYASEILFFKQTLRDKHRHELMNRGDVMNDKRHSSQFRVSVPQRIFDGFLGRQRFWLTFCSMKA